VHADLPQFFKINHYTAHDPAGRKFVATSMLQASFLSNKWRSLKLCGINDWYNRK